MKIYWKIIISLYTQSRSTGCVLQDLEASGSLGQFSGNFSVPSYRGTSFLDPKARCLHPPFEDVSHCGDSPNSLDHSRKRGINLLWAASAKHTMGDLETGMPCALAEPLRLLQWQRLQGTWRQHLNAHKGSTRQ